MSEDRHFHALRLLQANPELSQRALARELGVSVGAANYCVRALVEKGWIKIQNFRTSKDKRAYAYLLTPHGIEQKAQITLRFLQRKEAEYPGPGSRDRPPTPRGPRPARRPGPGPRPERLTPAFR